MPLHQRTVAGEIGCTGIGLHTGKKIVMNIKPLPPGSGIRFLRSDLLGSPHIPARLENVVDTRLSTTIGQDGRLVSTIEHLMSAFAGMGIDNALVEIELWDGSQDFVSEAFSEQQPVAEPAAQPALVPAE